MAEKVKHESCTRKKHKQKSIPLIKKHIVGSTKVVIYPPPPGALPEILTAAMPIAAASIDSEERDWLFLVLLSFCIGMCT